MQWTFVILSVKPLIMLRRELFNIAQLETSQSPVNCRIAVRPSAWSHWSRSSRLAIGNPAHAQKTPLALIFRLAEDLALRDKPAVQQALNAHADAFRRLIEKELKSARTAGARWNHPSLQSARGIDHSDKVVKTIYVSHALDITIQATDCVLAYDQKDFLKLLSKLIDDAGKWANHRIMGGRPN